MQPSLETTSRRWNPWPVSIILFFVVAILGCVSFVVFCSRHPADLVAADYYDQEIRYQTRLDSLNRTREPTLPASVNFDAARKAILIRVPHNHVVAGLKGQVQLYRPSSQQLDKQFPLQPGADGLQTVDASGLSDGLWRVRVSWTANRQDYLLDEKIVLGAVSAR